MYNIIDSIREEIEKLPILEARKDWRDGRFDKIECIEKERVLDIVGRHEP